MIKANPSDYPDLIDLDVGENNLAGAIFDDRNPEVFQIVLDYLRTGTIDQHLLSDQRQRRKLLHLLQKEAEYYLLTGLIDLTTASLSRT
ncbi:hypothetical protein HK097_007062 [Rhizophlyctis rosea]|uniref:Potassium channel tetramerisation-type BTB domain-containing protein n=1 Tax=Rhizophlyctis rosea TaxID=64517 RepID=A0AAD5SF99_9FUNG|nr:hypothetical protein HK097_007062 [Rhizophlyctis rosea]